MNNSTPTITEKSTKLSTSNNIDVKDIFNQGNLPSKNISNLARYFKLGYKECGTLWDSDIKLNTHSILTILSFDSCKHLLGEKDTQENWIAFKTGAIAHLENIGNNISKVETRYTFIEKSDDYIALVEVEKTTFNKFIQKEYSDLLDPKLYLQQDLELFFKQICTNISLSSFIPKKAFTKYLQILH
ncbi:hypothetical protein [Solibacillus isronensis]|uniref:hypothetical protein n=1 Tax=Solibacillus isronensis TaxID=412383 RepID=UPI0009A7BBE3|nr:hypothetical protein [Solibacillus isronensis]